MRETYPMDNLILIGMPGSGKSTVGPLLARETDRAFLDTDRLVEARGGGRLQEIIDRVGLAGFLEVEEAAILEMDVSGHVVATGGSVVYSGPAMNHLGKTGTLIWLDVDLGDLQRRLVAGISGRGVAIAPGRTIADLYAERQPLYERFADLHIRMNGRSAADVVREIAGRLAA